MTGFHVSPRELTPAKLVRYMGATESIGATLPSVERAHAWRAIRRVYAVHQRPTFVLPGMGIPWVIPTKRNFHEGQVEGVGLPVDSYLENIEEPVESLIPSLIARCWP